MGKRMELRPPGVLEWALFAFWIQAHIGNDKYHAEEEFNDSLKNLGFHAWDDNNYPHLKHWHPGPIEIGMKFIWAPTKDSAQVVTVTKVQPRDGDEPLIWCYSKSLGKDVYNEESMWRESCVTPDRMVTA